jgi:hypothetical protein
MLDDEPQRGKGPIEDVRKSLEFASGMIGGGRGDGA